MTKEQTEMFKKLVKEGRARAAMIYLANIMLGPEIASKILRPAR